MAQGLQVFDAEGRTTIDISDRLCKILGSVRFDGKDFSFKCDDLLKGGTFWYGLVTDEKLNDASYPVFTASGNTIICKYYNTVPEKPWEKEYKLTGTCYYGVY